MPLKIYYIDDEQDLLESFKETFESPEVLVTTFSDPTAAARAIEADPPDLLFLDFRLGRQTADDFATSLHCHVETYLITGDPTIEPRTAFKSVFEKPFNVDRISACIQDALKRFKSIKIKQ